MIERKCLNCQTWNKDNDFCTHCGQAISPKEIEKLELSKKKIALAQKPKDKFDLFAERLKNHKSPVVRFIYQVGYSVGMVFAAIGAFFAWLTAMANG